MHIVGPLLIKIVGIWQSDFLPKMLNIFLKVDNDAFNPECSSEDSTEMEHVKKEIIT